MSLDKKTATLIAVIAAGVVALVVLVGVGALAIYWRSTTKTGRATLGATPAPSAESRATTRRQLFLESDLSDDAARGQALKRILEESHERCDAVEKTAMISAGVWTVRCTPASTYRLTFGPNGKLLEVKKLL
jgi:hypothetical protein